MLPSEDEIIEKMVKAYEEVYLNHKPTPKKVKPYMVEIDWFPPTKKSMKAVLQALIASLPHYTEKERDQAADDYKQLLAMKDK